MFMNHTYQITLTAKKKKNVLKYSRLWRLQFLFQKQEKLNRARKNHTILRLLAEWHPVSWNHLEWMKVCGEIPSAHHEHCNSCSCNHWGWGGAGLLILREISVRTETPAPSSHTGTHAERLLLITNSVITPARGRLGLGLDQWVP